MDSVFSKSLKFLVVILGNILILLIFLGYIGFNNSKQILSSSQGLSGPGQLFDVVDVMTIIIALVLSLISIIIGGLIVLRRWIHTDPSSKRIWIILCIVFGFVTNYLLLAPPINLSIHFPRFIASLLGRF